MAICKVSGERFEVSQFEREYCLREGLPLPEISQRERLRALSTFRNRLNLYHGVCALSGRRGITAVPPESGFVVYDIDVWDSDQWDGTSYGREYDFSRPFFEQYFELCRVVPIPNLLVSRSTMENSDYTNGITGAKNCYLLIASSFNEDCCYSRQLVKCRDVYDTVFANHCELCYGCKNVNSCFSVFYSENCYHCSESSFLANCQSCKNCFGCVNLNNAQYCFFNEQLTAAEYRSRLAQIDLGSHQVVTEYQSRFAAFKANQPVRCIEGIRNENSSGAFLNNTKNVRDSYFVGEAEDLEGGIYVFGAKSCIAYFGYGNGSELIYNSVSVGDSAYNVKFSAECLDGVRDLEYCRFVLRGSSNCFGCVSLKKRSYCILNKQYSAAEYQELLPRIKKHMISTGEYGKFFPQSCNPHYYNKSEANDFFPESRSRVEQLGYRWRDEEPSESGPIQPLSDHVRDVSESSLKVPFLCEATGKRYKVLSQELRFHQRLGLALPRVAPLERLRLWSDFLAVHPVRDTQCAHCGGGIQTARVEKSVLCEPCYQRHVTG